ncbi:hypothetical protein EAH89_04465 [Roseomonas nepalensis]|uniref:Uncharacterized protein n=1 Tax=Muricoccus nepalensis TaxID=1854500 RepID=A0A502GG75_9PROT|nr:hypothetical protein [Roseomonas nepalensis]TPG60612.1 hypothetical protein EAH89_04465 [Roseomonas nepalensis]
MRDGGTQRRQGAHDALDAAGGRATALRADILARFFSSHLAPGDVVALAGPVDGASPLGVARRVAPGGRLLVFEPVAAAAAALRAGAEQAGLDEILDLRPATLADFNGKAGLGVAPGAEGAWSAAIRERAGALPANGLLRAARLDDALAPGTRLRALALALQGREAAALRGARRALAEGRPLLLLGTGHGVGAVLEEAGYEAHDLLGFPLAAGEADAATGWLLGLPREDPIARGTLHGLVDDVADRHGLSVLLA